MFSFCPHCGESIDQNQVEGTMLRCIHCQKEIGLVRTVRRVVIDETAALIRAGTVARCPECQQVVDVKASPSGTTLVPHYRVAQPRRICPRSGQAALPVARSASMTRDVIKGIYCKKNDAPKIDVLTLDYLDKNDRVRIQIEALREMFGVAFRITEYPPTLGKPHLAVWGNAAACFVAATHEQGGFRSVADADINAIVGDLTSKPAAFFDDSQVSA